LDPGNVLESYLSKRKRGAAGFSQQQRTGGKRQRPGRNPRGLPGLAAPSSAALGAAGLGASGFRANRLVANTAEGCFERQVQQQAMGEAFKKGAGPTSLQTRRRRGIGGGAAAGHIAGGSRDLMKGAAPAAGDECWQELDQIMGIAAAPASARMGETGWIGGASRTFNQGCNASGVEVPGLNGNQTHHIYNCNPASGYEDLQGIGAEGGLQSGFDPALHGSMLPGTGDGYQVDLQAPAWDHHESGLRSSGQDVLPFDFEDTGQYTNAQARQYIENSAWAQPGATHEGWDPAGANLYAQEYNDPGSFCEASNVPYGLGASGAMKQQPVAWDEHQNKPVGRSRNRSHMQLGYRTTGISKQTKLCWKARDIGCL
jgi:hypothetical protein